MAAPNRAVGKIMDAQALVLDMAHAAQRVRRLANLFAEYRKIGAHPDRDEINAMHEIAADIDRATAAWLERNRAAEAVLEQMVSNHNGNGR